VNKTVFRIVVGLIATAVIAGAGTVVHGRQVHAFVEDVAGSFSGSPVDAALVRTAGYPAGFLRAKIAAGELKTLHDAAKLMRGYKSLITRQEQDVTVEQYTYRVGLIPMDEMILLRYDEFGKLLGMPVDGANWR